MQVSRRVLLQSLTALGAGACASNPGGLAPTGVADEPADVIPLWPSGVPGGMPEGLTESIVFRDNPFGLLDRAAHDVTSPSLSVFRPAEPDGSAILIIPGGGYRWVVIDKEGFEGARHFCALGSVVYVLKYRLPHQGWLAGPEAPLQDAQRAMRMIRARAARDGIDPSRVLVMGFSAGGHLAGSLAQRFDAGIAPALDDVDVLPAHPDAAALIYPVVTMTRPFAHPGSRRNLIGDDPAEGREAEWSLEKQVRSDVPPVFLMHAGDDAVVPVDNALMLYDALRVKGCAAALHVFEAGGHGFGLRGIAGTPLETWPQLIRSWGLSKGIFRTRAV